MQVSATPRRSIRDLILIDRRGDLIALLVLFAGIAIVSAHRFYFDNWLARHDLLAFFLPWHGLLGERLANFDVPGWNANAFAGTPFLGDPESGWLYFPAMVVFPFLQITVAMKAMILVQLLIGGTATYSLGRVLGYGVLGALMSATAFTFGPFLMTQTECCTVGAGLSGWLPVAFLGIELGLRSRRWLVQIGSWGLSGLAISQMLAVWLGQGAAIGLLMVAAWVAYRGLIDPPSRSNVRQRIGQTLCSGIASLGIGLGISAWGLLPRLAVNSETSVQGGDYSNAPGARDEFPMLVSQVFDYLLRDDRLGRETAIGGIVAALVLIALVYGRQRYAIPFFVLLGIGIAALATPPNAFQDLMYLIPRFEDLQIHSPSRVFWIMSIIPSMLAGAGLKSLLDHRGDLKMLPLMLLPAAGFFMIRDYLAGEGRPLDASVERVALITLGIAVVMLIPWGGLVESWRETVPRIGAVALILLVFAWPNVPEIVETIRNPQVVPGQLQLWGKDEIIQERIETTLATDDPGGVGEFFAAREAEGELFRYVSYAGNGSEFGPNRSAPAARLDANIVGLLVNGRPMQLDLQQVSGYNPLQLLNFLRYLAVANGRFQDYHHADIFSTAAGSPLIDMLNVQYFVVDASLDPNRADVLAFSGQGPEVFRNELVVVYRNDSAFARAWIVHDVRATDASSLTRLNSGEVSNANVAFVDGYNGSQFTVSPGTAAGDTYEMESWEADSFRLRVNAGSDGFLVLSEVYAEGWKAYVDGEETEIHLTNGVLRGVAIGAGEHTVEVRYDPWQEAAGKWATMGFGLGTIGIWVAIAMDWTRRRRIA